MSDPVTVTAAAGTLTSGTWLNVVLASTVVAATVTAGTNWYLAYRAKRSAAIFSAIRIATTLEAFVRECDSALSDHQLFIGSKGAAGSAKISLPTFPTYPTDIVWTALPHTLIDRALSLASEVELDSRGAINFRWDIDSPDDYDTTIYETAECGLKALELASELRRLYAFKEYPSKPGAEARMREHRDLVAARDEQSRLAGDEMMREIET